MASDLRRLTKLAYSDTGPVAGSDNYTTICLIHGLGWHGRSFERMRPFATQNNARLVIINRRDFPGSEPYTEAERAQLVSARTAPEDEAVALLESYMCDRAREIFDFLGAFIKQEQVPPARGHNGGVILCTWSFAAIWMMGLLANVGSFPTGDTDLEQYIRRMILYDPPEHSMGFSSPSDPYQPLFDEAIPPSDLAKAFATWVSGYYTHGSTEETLERRTPVAEPSPTISRMTPDEIEACFSPGPAQPGGSDFEILELGNIKGLNIRTHKRAFYLQDTIAPGSADWRAIPLRHLWCDRSLWHMPWAAWSLRKEVEEARKSRHCMRNISSVCLRGANHFVHWDEPERFLLALLTENDDLADA